MAVIVARDAGSNRVLNFKKGLSAALMTALLTACSGTSMPSTKLPLNPTVIPDGLTAVAASFRSRYESRFQSGSNIYLTSVMMVEDGPNAAVFPASSKILKTPTGIEVTNAVTGKVTTFSSLGVASVMTDAVETIVAPGKELPAVLQRTLQSGDSHFARTLNLPQGAAGARVVSAFGLDCMSDDPDPSCDGGDPGESEDIMGGNVTDFNMDCDGVPGGENMGISYTVPGGYGDNLTVSLCSANDTTSACFPMRGQHPGTGHNVSVYLPGYGSGVINVNLISAGGVDLGNVGYVEFGSC